MKKSVSSVLILLLMLNIMGYYGFFMCLKYNNDRTLGVRLDKADYDNSQTITFRVPVVLPYVTDDPAFIRMIGQFNHEGEFFQIVKRKYAHDTLTVVCLRDPEQKRIHGALADFVKTFSDKPTGEQSGARTLPVFSKDYLSDQIELFADNAGWSRLQLSSDAAPSLTADFISRIVHPPERG